ncbi:ABC transporter ATP-binding protein [Microbacterium trichothecenolyticum]|uniref:ABC-type dipeptide/oligopeptide/nickel transport system ATPase component n=2 Tax=Microbacterium trichothecenolyticum TaxID=69370 RepID=A0ABU0TRI9_MICTR|nr:ABC transporter ATP-binding protein [Microbacterium trichothecenolyticum]MDQ1121517.1 ABC-type dipeptide/oligopeptide/nickel transport system ATPase component [Microbacterium trichothecenolyticum]
MSAVTSASLLSVQGLSVDIAGPRGVRRVVDDIALQIEPGESMGLVGESGSGKSMTLRAIMDLLPSNASVSAGSIAFDGAEIVTAEGAPGRASAASVRGAGITMVFQEPAIALNPVMKIGRQIVDGVQYRHGLRRRQARDLAIDLLERVGIDHPRARADQYPFELSGGMRQRVMIASAIASRPRLILCDEPTTALDVTVQAQILSLFSELRADFGLSLLYVTHDLAVVSQVCERIAVMRAGRIIETGSVGDIFRKPQNDYTRALLDAMPRVRPESRIRVTEKTGLTS